MTDNNASSPRWMSPSRWLLAGIVILMLAAAAWIRSRDIAAAPLDVSHSEQLSFILTARAYQAPSIAAEPGLPTRADYALLSPDAPVLQWLDAGLAGLFDADLISTARSVSIMGWMLTSLLLYLLVRRLSRPLTAVAVLAMMVFMPFSIQFSRVVLAGSWAMFFALLAIWQLWRWMEAPSWGRAILTGVFGSIAVLMQAQWLYILLGGLIAAWRGSQSMKRDSIAQGLLMAAFLIALRLSAALLIHPSSPLAAFLGLDGFALGLSSLKQLVRLELRLESIVGVLGIGFAILGTLLTQKGTRRSLLIGLWVGFLLMCLIFLKPISESIYSLYPVFLLAALSFIPLFELLLDAMGENKLGSLNLWALVAILIIAAGLGSIDGRRLVKANPEQIPVDFWIGAGEKLGTQAVFLSNTNAVTLPLAVYGGVQPACIAASGDCSNKVDTIAEQMPQAELYFVFFRNDLEKILAANDRLALSEYHCDLGSGVMMIPLTSNHPACNATDGQP